MAIWFRGEDNAEWAVYGILAAWLDAQTKPSSIPLSLRNGWLLFLSPSGRRRYVPIPEDWESLSHERLRQLLAEAVPVDLSGVGPASGTAIRGS